MLYHSDPLHLGIHPDHRDVMLDVAFGIAGRLAADVLCIRASRAAHQQPLCMEHHSMLRVPLVSTSRLTASLPRERFSNAVCAMRNGVQAVSA